MYFRMLKRDIKDKRGLNTVAFIFMIAAVLFTVVGTTMIYALFVGEKKTYEKCNSSDAFIIMDHKIEGNDELVRDVQESIDKTGVIIDHTHDVVVSMGMSNVEFVGHDKDDNSHFYHRFVVNDIPEKYDIPIDLDNRYFEVPEGCVAMSQATCGRFNVKAGDKVRLTTQMGNAYEYVIFTTYKNPGTLRLDAIYMSDSDLERFYSECPQKYDMFTGLAQPDLDDYLETLRDRCTDIMVKYEDYNAQVNASRMLFLDNNGLFAIIVTVCMLIVAVAVMIMTMITIDFSLKSAIKREAREIGMMKAIGVWSLSYKTLFIVKYIFFAIVGGVIGLPLGFLASKFLFDKFVMSIMYPDPFMMIMIGFIASIFTILIIVLSSFAALRRMNKISVIDAIHGENRGERFTALPGLSLNTKKFMPVPFHLAASDILRSFKRYLLLVMAYIIGICIVFFVVRLNDSLMSTDYAHTYFQQGDLDFMITIDDTYYKKLYSGAGSFKGAMDEINKNFEENGIPARITTCETGTGLMKFNGKESACELTWCDAPSSEIKYLEGNPPKLRNEVAMGYYAANERGIKIGDTVTLNYEKYADDHTTFKTVKEDFIVTAFVDRYGSNLQRLFMGDEFEGSVVYDADFFSCKIDAPKGQHEEIIEKMQALYPDGEITVLSNKEVMPHSLPGYQQMFRLIILIVSSICAVVMCLLTALYENIFIDEETSDIALLKSMGFGKGVIRAWHFLRLMLLSIFSLLLSYIFMMTAGNFLIEKLFTFVMKNARFRFTVVPFTNYVIIPVCVIAGLAIVTFIVTKIMDGIQIWKVRNE